MGTGNGSKSPEQVVRGEPPPLPPVRPTSACPREPASAGGPCRRHLRGRPSRSAQRCLPLRTRQSVGVPASQTLSTRCGVTDPFPLVSESLPRPGDCPTAELPPLPKQQDQLQPGVRDPAVPGLHLRQHHRRPRPARALHQREERRPHQPDPGEPHRVLPGALPREPGNSVCVWGARGRRGSLSFRKGRCQGCVQRARSACPLLPRPPGYLEATLPTVRKVPRCFFKRQEFTWVQVLALSSLGSARFECPTLT